MINKANFPTAIQDLLVSPTDGPDWFILKTLEATTNSNHAKAAHAILLLLKDALKVHGKRSGSIFIEADMHCVRGSLG